MQDELSQVFLAIEERDSKCRNDMKEIEERISGGDTLRKEVIGTAT